MKLYPSILVLAFLFSMVLGCDAGSPPAGKTDQTGSGKSPLPPMASIHHVPPVAPIQTVHRIVPLSSECSQPAVILTTIPGRWSRTQPLPWVDAAFRAHPEFVWVSHRPAKPNEIRIEAHPQRQKDDSESRYQVLVARCADAGTCNRVATMFASVVPRSQPETHCGATIPGAYSPGVAKPLSDAVSDDPAYQCARLIVCMRKEGKEKEGKEKDLGRRCERVESKPLACTKLDRCEQVVACSKL